MITSKTYKQDGKWISEIRDEKKIHWSVSKKTKKEALEAIDEQMWGFLVDDDYIEESIALAIWKALAIVTAILILGASIFIMLNYKP